MLSDSPHVRSAGVADRRTSDDTEVTSLPAWLIRLADGRRIAVAAGLAAAVLLPQISITSRLPDMRAEQLLLPYALLVFAVDLRLGRRFRLGPLDWIFAGLALSTLASILFAPLILHTHFSPRDLYEELKLALYYAFYRLARSAYERGGGSAVLLNVLLLAGAFGAVFALCQYFNWLHVNAWLTPLYALEPHLGVLRLDGRVVGTFANPNYFGIFCVVLLLGCLLRFWLAAGVRSWRPAFLALCAALASVGLVTSGSRTALLALAVAVCALLAFALFVYRGRASFARLACGSAIAVLLLAGAVLLVLRFPHGNVSYLGRVSDGVVAGDDASLNLRLARWRSVIDAWLPSQGQSSAAPHAPLTSMHATGVTPAPPDVLARDAQRKQDLLRLAGAFDAYHRTTGAWPAPDALQTDLVPRYLAALPLDPATDQPYPDVPTVTGYSLLAHLENPADPDYPIYGIGSSPNYLLNGDLEQGGSRPTNWSGIPGSSFALQRDDALYGDHAVLFHGDPSHPDQRAGIYQQRYFGRPGGSPFTATVWVKLLAPSSGRLDLYANVIYDDGSRADPLTRIPADMNKIGVWQKVSLGIQPPSGKTLAFMGIYVVSQNYQGQALLDGFQLVDGTVPLDFAITREAPPSDTLGFNPEAKLRSSPLIGVGPEKGEQGSALDDEYLLYAARYGAIGIVLYLALYLATLALAVRAFLRGRVLPPCPSSAPAGDGPSPRPSPNTGRGRRDLYPRPFPLTGERENEVSGSAGGSPAPAPGQDARRPGILPYLARALTPALSQAWEGELPALVALTMLAFLVFNITAGSFYELQLMAVFWLLAGAGLACGQRATGNVQRDGDAPSPLDGASAPAGNA